jgi:outer membrane lipoprotein-sorting protein
MRMTGNDGKNMLQHSRVYYGKDKGRIEMLDMATGGRAMPGTGTMIYRMDRQVMWMVMPSQGMYMEMPMPSPSSVGANSKAMPVNPLDMPHRKYMGTEMVNGQLADKYEITMNTQKRPQTMYSWTAKGSIMPVRVEMETGTGKMEIDYTNVRLGEPPAELFELPAGYRKFSLGGMMNVGR